MPLEMRSSAKDLILRLAGLISLRLAVLAGSHLYVIVHMAMVHDASPAEMAFAAAAFLCASAGVTLVALGAHIFDRVEVSARWGMRRAVDQIEDPRSTV